MSAELEALLGEVASTVQADARRRNLAPQIAARLAAMDVARARPAAWRFGLAGLGALACAGAAAFVLLSRPQVLSYAVAGAAGSVGASLQAPAAQPLELRFSDGSAVTVPPLGAARVDGLDSEGATVAVEGGTLEVSVVHRAHTHWRIRAGGYLIQVTGTRFGAGWDRNAQALTVTMHEGSVLVTGPGLAEPVRVVTGQRLRATVRGAELGLESSPEVGIGPREEMPEVPIAEAPTLPPPPVQVAPAPSEASVPAEHVRPSAKSRHVEVASASQLGRAADWRGRAARAEYREALAAAILDGWRDECARLGADDLVLLGDVARLAGDLPRAEEAYQSARRRFPSADRPIFALGLIAFEGRHDYRAAGGWFAAYLRSFPRGPLAREAAGRLIESRLKAGDDAEARLAASSYLRSFPDGPHAALARRTVGP